MSPVNAKATLAAAFYIATFSRESRRDQQRRCEQTRARVIFRSERRAWTLLSQAKRGCEPGTEEFNNFSLQNRGKGLDMNVQGAWAEGITGSGVVVTILDDGLEKDHPDLHKNYVSTSRRRVSPVRKIRGFLRLYNTNTPFSALVGNARIK